MPKIYIYSFVDYKPEKEYTIDLVEEPEITLKNVNDTFNYAREHYKDFSGQAFEMEFGGKIFWFVRKKGKGRGKKDYMIYPLGSVRDLLGLRGGAETQEDNGEVSDDAAGR